MKRLSNAVLDMLSEFISKRKGLLPTIGLLLILLDWVFQYTFLGSSISETSFFLHLGLVFVVLGFMLAWAL